MFIAGYCLNFGFKLLGNTLSNDLTWKRHVDNIVKKAGKIIYILYQIKRTGVNHISYADDMCILSFSSAGMQKLLNICDQYGNDHDLIYNSKKTMCMCFTPKSCKSYECKLSLNQESLTYVREARYLGVVIQLSGTDKDVYIDR